MTRGRPRTFDPEEALDQALTIFWRHGYEGASVAALAEAMGLGTPSLYAAFGNKEALFTRALDRYIEKPAAYLRRALGEPTARQVAESALRGAIDMAMAPGNAEGCLLVRGGLATSPAGEAIRRQLAHRRRGAEEIVRQRLERAKAEGDLPGAGADPAALARYLMTTIWGLSVQAAGGAIREELESIADTALRAWPE